MQQHSQQLMERCFSKVDSLFSEFSQNIGNVISEALSGSIDRYLARLTVNQAEQGDILEQIREILLAEQMKREEANSALETQLQGLTSQLDALAKQDTKPARSQTTDVINTSEHLHSPSSSQRNGFGRKATKVPDPNQRPQTPSEEYEDLFLHTLSRETDPLAILVDAAPPGRLDRVLPYDGKPLITAPNLLTLCMRLAKDFDNDLQTLDEANGRVRLAWILSCLRASKWAKANPQYAAYLPRVFTQVMHSLNARKKRLTNPDDIKLVDRVLRAADESSGLW